MFKLFEELFHKWRSVILVYTRHKDQQLFFYCKNFKYQQRYFYLRIYKQNHDLAFNVDVLTYLYCLSCDTCPEKDVLKI